MNTAHTARRFRLTRLQPKLNETPVFTLLRLTAATLVLAAGLLHLAQIGPHTDEDPLFGIFFVVVGVIQVMGGVYLLYPLGRERLRVAVVWFGVLGSLATIGIWTISRTVGLPFGAEPGAPETVGLADAAANLFELFTALLLVLWLYRLRLRRPTLAILLLAGAAGAMALVVVWLVTRQLQLFDPDPRLVTEGDLADLAAVGFLVVLTLVFARALFVATAAAPPSSSANVVLVAVVAVAALGLVGVTLPARGGQNRDCAYGPIREDSGLSHATIPPPIHLTEGEVRSVVVLLLVACGPDPVAVTSFDPIQPLGNALALERITIDRSRGSRADRVRPGESAGPAAIGTLLDPSQGRYPVVVQVRGLRPGLQALSAFKIGWVAGETSGSIGLASLTDFCVADAPCLKPAR